MNERSMPVDSSREITDAAWLRRCCVQSGCLQQLAPSTTAAGQKDATPAAAAQMTVIGTTFAPASTAIPPATSISWMKVQIMILRIVSSAKLPALRHRHRHRKLRTRILPRRLPLLRLSLRTRTRPRHRRHLRLRHRLRWIHSPMQATSRRHPMQATSRRQMTRRVAVTARLHLRLRPCPGFYRGHPCLEVPCEAATEVPGHAREARHARRRQERADQHQHQERKGQRSAQDPWTQLGAIDDHCRRSHQDQPWNGLGDVLFIRRRQGLV